MISPLARSADVIADFYDYGEVCFTMNTDEAARTWGDTIGYGTRSDDAPSEGSSYLTESRFGEDLVAKAKAAGLSIVRRNIADSYRLVSETRA